MLAIMQPLYVQRRQHQTSYTTAWKGCVILREAACVTCDRGPPAARVVIKELHLDHGVNIVPLPKDYQAQTLLLNIVFQLADLLWVILFLAVDHQQSAILHEREKV